MTYAATVLADSPSVYYRLGDTAAPAVPTSGLGVNAAMTGTVTFGQPGGLAGDSDTAVSFPATGTDYLQTATSPGAAYDFADGPMSVEFWYKTGTSGVLQNAVSKGTNGYIARLSATNKWIFRKSGATDILVTTATFTDTTGWHHFVATRNGTGSANTHIYVDGADQAGTYTEPATGIANTTTGFAIGVDAAAKTTGPWNGLLDEVALYPAVLTQAQVTAHYLAGPPVTVVPRYAQPGQTWLRRFRHRQQPQQAPAATVTAIALADAGSADDSFFTVAADVPLAETGAGADSLAVTAAVPLAEAGAGADTLAIAAAIPLADTGTGADTLVTGSPVSLAETGAGAQALTVSAAVPAAEGGSAADTFAVTAAVPLAETGAGAQALTVLAALALADAGTALDTLSVAAALPFTIGALTAADKAASALTAAGASSALTASTAPSGALTAGDQRTGGPS